MIVQHLIRQWFLAVLLAALVIGFVGASTFRVLAETSWLKWSIVVVTMFMMAWPLETRHLLRTIRRPVGPLLGSLVNLALVPLLAWPVSFWLGPELGPGLILAAAVPSTLATGAVWTRRAGGDDSVAIMVTIVTNLLCFVVTPAWVFYLTGNQLERTAFVGTVYKLLFFVVLPMVLAQLSRSSSVLADYATARKHVLSRMALTGVLMMVFLAAISTGLRVQETGVVGISLNQFVGTMVSVLVIHLLACFAGISLARLFGRSPGEQIAVGISGSQKTLMVGLSTAISMGLNVIPLVAYHSTQLIVDAVIADRHRNRHRSPK